MVAVTDIRRVKFAFQNYRVPGSSDGQELGAGVGTYTASVEYPSGVFSQITFGGQVQGTAPALSILECDYATPPQTIPSGATYWLNAFEQNASGIFYCDSNFVGGLAPDTSLGDKFNFNTPTPTDQTMGGTITNENASHYSTPPAAAIGLTNQPSVICTGDSIMGGLQEVTGIKDARWGEVCRAFPALTLAFLNHGSASAKASNILTNSYLSWSVNRRQVWKYGRIFIDELGYNDIIYGGDSVATTQFSLRSNIWANYPRGAIIIRTTLTPKSTDVVDSFATTANQTTSGNNSVRVSFNTDIRNSALPQVRFFIETAWAVEDAHDNGKWVVNGTANWSTRDGDHPEGVVGYGFTSGAVDMTKITWPQ